MSKIAEQKALEAYPVCDDTDEFNRIFERKAYINGYDQASQDFLEYLKYCSTFTDMNGNTIIDDDLLSSLTEDFKNYMQNEEM